MSILLITGSAGLIGSEATRFFHERGFDIVGVDNNMREYFFGADGSTIGDLLTLPFLDEYQTGTAPKGQIERSLEKFLHSKNGDEDDMTMI